MQDKINSFIVPPTYSRKKKKKPEQRRPRDLPSINAESARAISLFMNMVMGGKKGSLVRQKVDHVAA